MKVVLLETVEGLGTAGQEIKVKDGYGRNFLIPRGKALDASDKSLNTFKDKIQSSIKAEAKTKEHAQKTAEEMNKIKLSFKVKAGDDGKLFGSITSADIFESLKEKGFEIDKKKIVLSEPIRHLGSHTVNVKLYNDVTSSVAVEVISEGA